MTSYVLDTNILSNATKPSPSPALIAWIGALPDSALFISALTVAEIRRGILALLAGRKRRVLDEWFFGPEGPQRLFAGRILAFDGKAALVWARLMAEGVRQRRRRNALDIVIAGLPKPITALWQPTMSAISWP